ncbi:MAG: hypothetical protein ABSG31_16235 [Tepidisphaeraceae bacterium]|jgi:anion-transporting  ArsA/GET3 family ATPase
MKSGFSIFIGMIAVGFALGLTPRAWSQESPTTQPQAARQQPFVATPQEWAEVMQFLDDNSPNRAHALRNVMDNPASQNLRQMMIQQYRAYQLMKNNLPEVAELRLKQFRLEDQLYGLTSAPNAGERPETANELRPQVRDIVKQIVDLQIQQEQLRIQRLQNTLDEEKQRLANVQADENQLIARRTVAAMMRARMTSRVVANPSGSTRPSDDLASPSTPDGTEVKDPSQSTGGDQGNPMDPNAVQAVPADGAKN